MADYTNSSASILSYGGKDYAPGEKIPLRAEAVRNDPTVKFWKDNGFISEGAKPVARTDPGPLSAEDPAEGSKK